MRDAAGIGIDVLEAGDLDRLAGHVMRPFLSLSSRVPRLEFGATLLRYREHAGGAFAGVDTLQRPTLFGLLLNRRCSQLDDE